MMDEEEKKSLGEFLEEIHEEIHGDESPARSMGLEFDLTIRHEDVVAYVNRHPFLQILNLDPTFEDYDNVNFVKSSAGWTIQDFGDALSASQGELMHHDFGRITLFAEEEPGEEGEKSDFDEEESDLVPGAGTVVKQAVDTANDMVELIKERWKGVHIVDGAELMKWAAWKAARNLNMEVYGYEPSNEARVKRGVVERAELQRASKQRSR